MRSRVGKDVYLSDTRTSDEIKSNKKYLIKSSTGSDNKLDNDNTTVDDVVDVVNKTSFSVQQLTTGIERAARCAIRAAVTTKSGIDSSKKSMRGMRKITLTMTDVVDALELLMGHINELCDMIVYVNNLTKKIKLTAEKSFDNTSSNQQKKEHTAAIKEITYLIDQLNNKTDRMPGIVDDVLADVDKFAKVTQDGTRLVEECYQTTNETGMVIEKVMDNIEVTSGQIDKISTLAEDVTLLSSQMTEIMQDINNRINKSYKLPV